MIKGWKLDPAWVTFKYLKDKDRISAIEIRKNNELKAEIIRMQIRMQMENETYDRICDRSSARELSNLRNKC